MKEIIKEYTEQLVTTREIQFDGVNGHVFYASGDFWFLADDVARWLGYLESSLSKIPDIFADVPGELQTIDLIYTSPGYAYFRLITELGLYWFAARSGKQNAVKFIHWITDTVIPRIRNMEPNNPYAGKEWYAQMTAKERFNLFDRHYYKPAPFGRRRAKL